MMQRKTIPLALLLALSLLIGWLEYASARSAEYASGLATTHVLLALALVFAWFRLDAQQRRYRVSWPLQLAIAAFTVCALPYYLFHSRGAGGGFRAMAWALLLFAASMICYAAGAALAA